VVSITILVFIWSVAEVCPYPSEICGESEREGEREREREGKEREREREGENSGGFALI